MKGCYLNRVDIKASLSKKTERDEGSSHVVIWGRVFSGKGTAKTRLKFFLT